MCTVTPPPTAKWKTLRYLYWHHLHNRIRHHREVLGKRAGLSMIGLNRTSANTEKPTEISQCGCCVFQISLWAAHSVRAFWSTSTRQFILPAPLSLLKIIRRHNNVTYELRDTFDVRSVFTVFSTMSLIVVMQ